MFFVLLLLQYVLTTWGFLLSLYFVCIPTLFCFYFISVVFLLCLHLCSPASWWVRSRLFSTTSPDLWASEQEHETNRKWVILCWFWMVWLKTYSGSTFECFNLLSVVDLIIDDVHVEESSCVVGEQTTVKEELGQCQVNHSVILFDDWFHSIIHQWGFLVWKVKEHPLQTQQTLLV